MREAIDYNALSWVRKELGETLRQARLELESYADGDGRNELLQRCAAQLHQVRGPLQMVSLKGADLLACEMEEAIADLLLGTVTDQQTLLEFLMQGFLELPEYLFSLRSGRHDAPMAMFPVINSLRATRGLEPLREDEIFSPNLSCRVPASVFDVRAWHDDHDISGRARAARVRFQSGLLEWYRGDQDNRGVGELVEVLEYLQSIACSEPAARLWWVGAGVAELLRDGVLQDSAVVKRLFGQLDRNIKRLMDNGESVFSDLLTDDLLKNLLFQISQAGAETPRLQLIRNTYGLQEPAVTAASDAAGALSDELLQSVSLTARDDVERIKDQLNSCLRSSVADPAVFGQVADEMHALGNMLGMIGMNQLGDAVASQEQFLRQAQVAGDAGAGMDFTDMASTLVAVEDALVEISGQLGKSAAQDQGEVVFRQGQEAVIAAIMADITAAKLSLNEYLKTNGEFSLLDNVPVLLHKICGGLVLAGEERLAAATDQVKRFITRVLLAEHRALDGAEQDDLADAICSIEYSIEQLVSNQSYGEQAIQVAEDRLCKLGYPVSKTSGHESESGAAADVIEFAPAAGGRLTTADPECVAEQEPAAVYAAQVDRVPDDIPARELASAAGAPQVAAHSGHGAISTMQIIAADADQEIVEIFIEEAGEVMVELSRTIPVWCNQPDDADLLAGIRRGFHTIKGSGRMVGAKATGEFAWVFESLLNKVIEHYVPATDQVLTLVNQSVPAMRQLVAQVGDASRTPDADVDSLAELACLLSNGATVPDIGSLNDPVVALAGEQMAAAAAERDDVRFAEVQEIDTGDEPDNALLDLFATECSEHLEVLSACLVDAGESCVVAEQLFRALHTLAGICESAQIPGIGALAEPLYGYFGSLYHDNLPAVPAAFAVLDDCVQEMQRQHAQLPVLSFDEWVVAQLQDRIHALSAQGGACANAVAVADGMEEFAAAVQYDAISAIPAVVEPEPEVIIETVSDPVVTELLTRQDEPALFRQTENPLAPEVATGSQEPEIIPREAQSVADAVDPFAGMDQELFDIFVEESSEIMEAGEVVLRDWSGAPENRDLMAEFQRMLHTLKGGARMVDIGAIGDLSHAVESLLGQVDDGSIAITAELFVLLKEAFDRLADMVDRVRLRLPAVAAADMEQRLHDYMFGSPITAHTDAAVTAANDCEIAPESVVTPVTAEVSGECVQPESECADSPDCPAAYPLVEETTDTADNNNTVIAVRPHLVAASPEFPAFAEMAARTAERGSLPDGQAANTQGRGEQVRVAAEVLDDLVNNAGEISIYRSRMEQQVSSYRFNLGELDQTISRLRDQLRQMEMETETQILYRFEQESDGRNEDFDPLEMDRYSNLQQLSRSLIESISDLRSLQEIMEQTTRDAESLLLQQSRVNTDLQESLIRTRMVPFAGLAPRLHRVVRQTARDLNKKVELELQGADGEMDRSVVSRIIAPLEHMLRNAIAHGIEYPEQRTDSGKQAVGTIRINLDREGPEIVLRVADDGAGMNLPAIRERAIERGLMAVNDTLEDYEVMQFILATGFSTASEVTQISGRGVGMDVVSSEVRQLGGSLHIRSEAGKGTVFTVRLPYTLAINQALLVQAGEESFFVPLGSIEGVVRMFPEELIACYRSPGQAFEYAGSQYRLKHLGTLLGTGGMDLQHTRQQVPVLLIRIGEQRIGMQVEALLGNREVVIKPLGVQLSNVEGISGATILGDGRVVMILDMVAISRINSLAHPCEVALRPQQDGRLMVMVVDDSITVRKVTTRLLERNGYQVLTAKDGVDAMGQLQEAMPDMLLLDIEMPRMDGFELATHMRNDERLRHVPIIMITSRTGDKHRERAREIGVNQYLGKPFQESALLDSIQNIIGINPIAATG